MQGSVGYKGTAFILEDEPLILLELRQMLAELRWKVSHFASDIDRGMEIARNEDFDLAILDVNLRGRTSLNVAEILQERQVPVILSTGYSTKTVIDKFPGAILLVKPYLKADLENALARAEAEAQSRARKTA